MALSSTSTLANALAQYNDNLSWDGNATKAALALEAVRWLLVNRPAATAGAGTNMNFTDLAAEKRRLESFLDGPGSTSRVSFVEGRPKT